MPRYDGLTFRSSFPSGEPTIGHYHQDGEVVWAEFSGGPVTTGRLVGRCLPDGRLELAYSQLMVGGEVVAGRCTSTPETLPDGRVRLRESWRRFDERRSTGVSWIEELEEG